MDTDTGHEESTPLGARGASLPVNALLVECELWCLEHAGKVRQDFDRFAVIGKAAIS